MPRLALTDRFVAGAKSENAPQTDYFDAKTPGLALRVTKGGHKAWTYIFTAYDTGKRTRASLGTYPALPLAAARTKAAEARAHLHDGADPRVVLNRRGAAEITVAELVARYCSDPDKAKLRSLHEIKRRLVVNALPTIGHIPLAKLTKPDVRDVTNKILRRGARTQAWHTHKDLNTMLNWAVSNDFLAHNPIEGMEVPGGFTAGERTLSAAEMQALWRVLPTALAKSKACQRVVKLCLITGQRLGEVAGMTRSELDLEKRLWSLPGARTKNKHQHAVPLSDMALAVIREALADAGKVSNAVFPAADGGSLDAHVVTRAVARAHETSKERPKGRFGFNEWSVHDLRRTCLSGLAELGVEPHVIAHVANHRSLTKSGVTFAHYVQHSYEPEKRRALDLWADRVQANREQPRPA